MENKKQIKRRKNKYAAPVGGLFIILAVVGLITVFVQSFHLTNRIMDNSGQLQKFENIIKPVIMFDPVPFDNIEDADNNIILQSSLWYVILNNPEDHFQYSSNGMILITASDVDMACAKLYGAGKKIEHQSFGDYDITYYFDKETQTYQVPSIIQTGFYTPQIVEVLSAKDDIVSLVVAYIPPYDSLTLNVLKDKKEITPDKYMVYELRKIKDNYFVSAIKYPPEKYSQYNMPN